MERILGFRIPESLRRFYEEIGYGAIGRVDKEPDEMDNFVVSPWALASLYKKTHPAWQATEVEKAYQRLVLDEPESPLWHLADDGEMPFINLDHQFYLVLRPLSDNPDAVYFQRGGELVSDDFAKLAHILKDDPLYVWNTDFD